MKTEPHATSASPDSRIPDRTLHPRHPLVAAVIAAVAGMVMVAAFGTAPDTMPIDVPLSNVIEQLSVAGTPAATEDHGSFVREERIRPGDSVGTLLNRLGADDAGLKAFLRNDKASQVIFRQISPGKTILMTTDSRGTANRLLFPLNGAGDKVLAITRDASGALTSTEEKLPLETRTVIRSAEIRHSLFGATDSAGIPDAIATQLADVFGGEIDFHRDLRKGDRFAVVYESVTYLGKEVRAGRLLAAEFVNANRRFVAAWHVGAAGESGYYTPEGKSLRKAFLRSPLEFSRVTSGFTNARFHPVLQSWRAHRGIDYGAPVGTRVKTTGSGVVEFAGVKGGYGKVVVVRHPGQIATLYAHLSGFGAGIRAGTRVSQGDTVGFVGATGLASGPHLHYEFQRSGVHQNPLAAVLPDSPPLSAKELPLFRESSGTKLGLIERLRLPDQQLALVN